MSDDPGVRGWLASPPGRGGVAILELRADRGSDLERLLRTLAPGRPPAAGEWRVARIAEVDDGVVARVEDRHAQLMPHGGPAIVRRVVERLVAAGVRWDAVAPAGIRPEALDATESLALETMARASSPAAIDVLRRQCAAWNRHLGPLTEEERTRGRRLDHLLRPPLVACLGAPNAGKSSLLNALARDRVAIVSPMAGTTRDRVARVLELDGVVVEWIDTPGLRESDDEIERAAIALAAEAVHAATLVVHLDSPDTDPPPLPSGLDPVAGVIRVLAKSDLPNARPDAHDLAVSATHGEGLSELARLVRSRLVHDEDLAFTGRWSFHPTLAGTPG